MINPTRFFVILANVYKKKSFMKNHRLSVCCFFLMVSLVPVFCISCQKRYTTVLSDNKLVPIESSGKAVNQFVLYCSMGHDRSTCHGCVMIDGVIHHIDCQGGGSKCRKASSVSLTSTDSSLCATTVDTFGLTDLDVLNMPSRSFALEIDEGVYSYLNIPAQLVYRDSATLQFTFTGLSFTGRPLYGNN